MKRLWLFALMGTAGMFGTSSANAAPIWSLGVQFGTTADISNTGRSIIRFTPVNTTSTTLNGTPIFAKITETSSVTAAHPDPITRQNYGFYLKLTDLASHTSRMLWISGSLSGTLSKTTSNLTNHFNAPSSYAFVLGKDKYTVSLGPMVLPSASNHFQGSIALHVVDPPISDGVSAAPEPATFSLAAVGLILTGLGAWQRRKRSAR